MATIKEIHVGVARTINLGNYESLRIEAGVTVAIAEGDDMAKVKAGLQPELRALLEETYRAQHKPKQEPAAQRSTNPTNANQAPGGFKPATPDPEH